MKTPHCALHLLTACFVAAAAAVPAVAAPSPAAIELVQLMRLQEREAGAIRFMLEVSPFELPAKTGPCMLARSGPAFTEHFANRFSSGFTDAELREAVAFFKSPPGTAAVAARLAHEKSAFEAAARQQRVESDTTNHAPAVQKALDAFEKTAAGAKFDLVNLAPTPAAAGESASDVRSRLMAECLQAP